MLFGCLLPFLRDTSQVISYMKIVLYLYFLCLMKFFNGVQNNRIREDAWVRNCNFDEDKKDKILPKVEICWGEQARNLFFSSEISFRCSWLTNRKTRKKMKGKNFLFEVVKLIVVLENTKGSNKSNFLQIGKSFGVSVEVQFKR